MLYGEQFSDFANGVAALEQLPLSIIDQFFAFRTCDTTTCCKCKKETCFFSVRRVLVSRVRGQAMTQRDLLSLWRCDRKDGNACVSCGSKKYTVRGRVLSLPLILCIELRPTFDAECPTAYACLDVGD